LTLWAELSRQLRREQATKSNVRVFWAMLPDSAALPDIKWPPELAPPRECEGVLAHRKRPAPTAARGMAPAQQRRLPYQTAMQSPRVALLQGQFLGTVDWNGIGDVSIESDWDGDGQLERAALSKDTPSGIRFTLTNGDESYRLSTDIRGLDDIGELPAGARAQLAAIDMTRDGIPDLLLAVDDGGGNAFLNIWFFDREVWAAAKRGVAVAPVRYMGAVEGQSEFVIVPGGVVKVPFGGQGRYFTAAWNGTTLVETE
jgi:hypothetical protein